MVLSLFTGRQTVPWAHENSQKLTKTDAIRYFQAFSYVRSARSSRRPSNIAWLPISRTLQMYTYCWILAIYVGFEGFQHHLCAKKYSMQSVFVSFREFSWVFVSPGASLPAGKPCRNHSGVVFQITLCNSLISLTSAMLDGLLGLRALRTWENAWKYLMASVFVSFREPKEQFAGR